MVNLIHFLSDMLGTAAAAKEAQAEFVRDPEDSMTRYGLSEEQKEAVRARDGNALGQEVALELSKLTNGGGQTNW